MIECFEVCFFVLFLFYYFQRDVLLCSFIQFKNGVMSNDGDAHWPRMISKYYADHHCTMPMLLMNAMRFSSFYEGKSRDSMLFLPEV